MSNSVIRAVAATVAGLALLGLAACARPTTGVATAAAVKPTVSASASVAPAPAPVTPPPATVTAPPATVTVSAKPLTPCQKLHADGYSYPVAFAAWEQAGYPPNWDADHDGYPCEQSYGEQN